MVFSNLLGPAKELRRRRSSAASSASGSSSAPRPLSASSGRASRSSGKGANDEDEGDEDEDTPATDSALSASASPEYIAFDTQLAPVAPEPPDLRDLNHSLDALAVVFPDVQVDVFREMLTNFDGESRLALVADALLKNRVTWVKGRWRTAAAADAADRTGADGRLPPPPPPVSPADRFRTPAYKKAATALACHEFVGLSRSTIHAVLAEHNYAYLDARSALVHISTKSWRFALSSLFLRRKPVTAGDAENHPLVVWKSSGRGSILPTVKVTGSPELDRELYDALVAPLRAQQRQNQEAADRAVAAALNTDEAEAVGAVYECACCFSTAPFEEVVVCSAHGEAAGDEDADGEGADPHIICFRCVQLAVREAVFGQGWARTIDPSRGTLRCPAASLDRAAACYGIVPVDHLHRALLAEPRVGSDVLRHLDRRLADLSLLASGLPLVRCPFCAYAEVDDLYVPSFHDAPLRLHLRTDGLSSIALLLLLLFGATPALLLFFFCLAVAFVAALGVLAVWLPEALPDPLPLVLARVCRGRGGRCDTTRPAAPATGPPGYWGEQLEAAVTRFRRRRRGHQFRCQNAAGACGRVSCLRCGKAWTDIHVCHESSLLRLRTEVEQAMSMAIKRVCPRCHTSFVKTAGCNKLTCPCGYKMCYVCRRDISARTGPDAGYTHFCEHFRPDADPTRPCAQCRKCNLWAPEDTAAVLRAARAEAEQRWRETEQRELTSAERVYLETGLLRADGTAPAGAMPAAAAGVVTGVAPGPAPALESAAATWHRLRATWATAAATVLAVARALWAGGDGTGGAATTVKDGPHQPTVADALDWLLEAVFM